VEQCGADASCRIAAHDPHRPADSGRPDWVEWVDRPQMAAEEAALARCVRESRPFGSDHWREELKKDLGWREPKKRGARLGHGDGRSDLIQSLPVKHFSR
jgi:hypothetical protein